MGLYDALFSAVFNILSIYINIRILKLFLPIKITIPSITIPIYTGIWLFNWCIYYFLNIPNLTTISLLIGLMIAAGVIFDGSILKKALAIIISNASGIIAENIVWKFSTILMLPIKSESVGGLCSVVLKFLIVLVIEHYISPNRYARLTMGGYLNILLISIGSVILSEVITLQDISSDSSMLCLSIICLINVGTYYMYEKISESWEEKLKNAEMEQQIQMYSNQFDIIKQTQQNIGSLKHDMKNHISLLNIFLADKEYEKASEYVRSLSEGLENEREYVKTGNIEIDSILNYKLKLAETKLGCRPIIQIDVPDQSFMPGFDLNVLLGNLLDNATEAVSNVNEKFLNIQIKYAKGVLYISIYNSFNGKLCEKEGRLLSTKKNAENHGVGLDNVKKIVKKFNGTIKLEHKDKLFKIDIILFPEAAKI